MMNPWILGIASSHNGAACLLHGNSIVVAIQEERLLRVKRAIHPGAFPSLAIQYCLDTAGVRANDLQAVSICAIEASNRPQEDLRKNPQLEIERHGCKVFAVSHHLGHAIAAYALSGREEASVLVLDGSGSVWDDLPVAEKNVVSAAQRTRVTTENRLLREVASTYYVNRGVFVPLEKHVWPLPVEEEIRLVARPSAGQQELPVERGMMSFHSLGLMYSAVGAQIFGSPLEGPGKVMGLAPYGKPEIPVHEFYRITDWGLEFLDEVPKRFPHSDRWPNRRLEYQNLAASVQKALEEGVLRFCNGLRRRSSGDFLCYAGGVALNSVANERILRESGFLDAYLMPAAEDSGTAIGAAFYALWQLEDYSPTVAQKLDSMGRHYAKQEVNRAIRSAPGVTRCRFKRATEGVCDLLAQGKILGWFQGGAELGPRALGHRSILCDPRIAGIKDTLNAKIKLRESFRPFAPVLPEEDVAEWFDVELEKTESPFMLRVMRFRSGLAQRVPAVVHCDQTGRVQTVSRSTAPRLHALLTRWKRVSGVPILLNTSFNIAGEPIVETPEDALWCMLFTGMDGCVFGNQVVLNTLPKDALYDCIVVPCFESYSLYNSTNKQDNGILIPELLGAPEVRVSSHIGRISQLEPYIKRDHLRIVVRKTWGDVLHGMFPAFVKILDLIDGLRTAREIFAILATSESPDYTDAHFRKHLGILRRADMIRFAEQPRGRKSEYHARTSSAYG